MNRLADQVAIVTGGALGIGGATARRLAEEGAKVVIADINIEAAQQNEKTIKQSGGVAYALSVDVTKHEDIKGMVDKAVDEWGRLDILVNNAISGDWHEAKGGALEVTNEGWDKGMAGLVKQIFLAVKYAVPQMKNSSGGKIVNISSVHGLLNTRKMLVYETGKAAVIGLTRQMAVDFGPLNIRVNVICPGLIITERYESGGRSTEYREFFKNQYLLRKTGLPVDIANAAVFLCSEESSFVTGHSLVVDGGLTIQLQEDYAVQIGQYVQEHPELKL